MYRDDAKLKKIDFSEQFLNKSCTGLTHDTVATKISIFLKILITVYYSKKENKTVYLI